MNKSIYLTGQIFGRLVVIKRVENDKWRHCRWLCLCSCGDKKKIIVTSNDLKRGHAKSCGCLQKEKVTKHGYCKTGFYRSWRDRFNDALTITINIGEIMVVAE